ncbi:MAG TPA: hypothetical protein VHA37_05250 [Candidatus Saccharimonadales bacterium]|nr:hypothetical protein [Candidatus Saccharimonadales bacterium]
MRAAPQRRSLAIAILFVLGFAGGMRGQNPAAIQAAEAACGPVASRFDVDVVQSPSLREAPPGSATVYVIENAWLRRSPTVRIAMDGKWVGATRGWTYLVLTVKPGEHHLCISKQTRSDKFDNNVALAPLQAQPGQTYYFQADAADFILPNLLMLEQINPDEARLLIAERALAQPHAKSNVAR